MSVIGAKNCLTADCKSRSALTSSSKRLRPEARAVGTWLRQLTFGACVLCVALASPAPGLAQEERLEQSLARENWRQSDATEARRQRFIDVVRTMSSTPFAGRSPGTAGAEQTLQYLDEQFRQAGLVPADGHSSFLQPVPLTRFQSRAEVLIHTPGSEMPTALSDKEFVVWSSEHRDTLSLDGQPVFAGYGIDAPEYGWNDYRDLDVRGRIVMVLIGDPPSEDSGFFEGRSMSRHGRWDRKLAVAAGRGATAVILIHDAGAAGYPFAAVLNTFGKQRINLSEKDKARQEPLLSLWISEAGAQQLLTGAATDLKQLEKIASRPITPNSAALGISVEVNARITRESLTSYNLVGRTPAPATSGAAAGPVVMMAHWDHLGSDDAGMFPGAADNASGIAQMLDIARRSVKRPPALRPIVFIAPTAEESGLLGARQYVRSFAGDDPVRPVAAINVDIANIFGRAQDVEVIGLGLSSLDRTLEKVARDQQRQISPDYAPTIGRLYRSDQYEFIRAGIPAVWIRGGRKARTFSLFSPLRQIKQYLRVGYHQRGDTIRDWWQVDAALEDANLIEALLHELAAQTDPPAFEPGSPYLNRR